MAQPVETIQIQVPTELVKRLRPHHDELPQILEWGLWYLEQVKSPHTAGLTEPPPRDRVLAALRSTGIVVALDPAIAARYRTHADQPRHTPVPVKGKPLSDMIVEERHRQWADSQ
ncbi:MAG: hypothetical protein KKA73_19980 [Chloroflexi bacterium]|nr:hypothetical protein [Chloroflexota bacterium]MBU1749969.1 hypothetical protein [Chloroflexota bacterium]